MYLNCTKNLLSDYLTGRCVVPSVQLETLPLQRHFFLREGNIPVPVKLWPLSAAGSKQLNSVECRYGDIYFLNKNKTADTSVYKAQIQGCILVSWVLLAVYLEITNTSCSQIRETLLKSFHFTQIIADYFLLSG